MNFELLNRRTSELWDWWTFGLVGPPSCWAHQNHDASWTACVAGSMGYRCLYWCRRKLYDRHGRGYNFYVLLLLAQSWCQASLVDSQLGLNECIITKGLETWNVGRCCNVVKKRILEFDINDLQGCLAGQSWAFSTFYQTIAHERKSGWTVGDFFDFLQIG